LYQVAYSPRAEEQLTDLLAQIALAASPEIAARYVDAIVAQCDSLSTFPRRGARHLSPSGFLAKAAQEAMSGG
jgi:plasmid stabilization system protein ParE